MLPLPTMPCISQLDFDILNCLADHLDAHDLLSLCLTCKSLYRNVLERPPGNLDLCEKTLRNSASYSWEYVTTRSRRISASEDRKRAFREAFRRYCARTRAFALGKPAAAYVLSSNTPSDVVYGDGAVAYIVEGRLEFLDLRSTGRRACMPLKEILDSICSDGTLRYCELLRLGDEIVVLNSYVDCFISSDKPFLLAIDFSDPVCPRSCMDAVQFNAAMKFFVRHNRDYLYWGTHSGNSMSHDHHEWTIQGVALSQSAKFASSCSVSGSKCRKSLPMQLRDVAGSNVGSEIDFRIHKGYFYAVSNCEFELVEIDWTSFYRCIKFPLNRPEVDKVQKKTRVYRRQHNDGVIQDGWLNLSLQVDERTDEILIVEALNEFRTNYEPDAPRHARTWYTSRIDFDKEDDQDSDCIPPLGPDNDPLVLLRESNSNYAPKQDRDLSQRHSEIDHQAYQSTLPQLKYMKSMSYNLNTQSFLDILVNLDCSCPLDGYCLQFRSGHRWLHSVTSPGNISANPTVYRHNRIRTWPPPARTSQYAESAHTIMNLPADYGDVVFGWDMRIIGDDRFLLILLKGHKDRTKDRLLLVSFDKFAPISRLNSLGCEDIPASENFGCFNPKMAVRQTESTPPWGPCPMQLDDAEQEVIDAEDLDVEDVLMEGGWS